MPSHTVPDPAHTCAAAIAALPPGACRYLTQVLETDIRPTPQDPWTHVAVPSGTPPARTLDRLIMHEMFNEPGKQVHPGSIRTVWQHLTPCPVCELHAAPGPRVYGLFLTDHQDVAYLDDPHADLGHHLSRIQMFANAAHAREQAELYADAYNRRNARADFGGVMRYTEIVPIVVPARRRPVTRTCGPSCAPGRLGRERGRVGSLG